MHFAVGPQQRELAGAVREVVAAEWTPDAVREAWNPDAEAQWRRRWAQLAEVGVFALCVGEVHGGYGLSEVDLVPVIRELGYGAVPGPLATTVAVAPLLAGSPAGRESLDGVLSGSTVCATNLGSGSAAAHARRADVILLCEGDGCALYHRDGVDLEALSTMDGSRFAARVLPRAAGTPLVVTQPDLALAWERGALATAAQLVGLGRGLLDLTVGYVKQRHQFGVPVGSFQVVQHQLADVRRDLDLAWPAVLRAAWSMRERTRVHARDVSVAAVLAAEGAYRASRTALQLHGAMGYTTEYPLHLFATQVWALAADFGGVGGHLDRVQAALRAEVGAGCQ